MLPTYKRLACLVIVEPIGTGATPGVVNNAELCIALYCTGDTVSNPGGGMSQYFDVTAAPIFVFCFGFFSNQPKNLQVEQGRLLKMKFLY
ncbi:hypothetical protein DERP_013770 [Dermatophagoides pteronyssinus]|uniref:Uncharacterized protein n=1 Tax=Dermatophagoides pteronyssinus TaxID=6956 RepID=A0ABQ8JFY2_DERPT|nr:hypothetical protein DERP_013770 [Dermatophagoides pteronyssinus]